MTNIEVELNKICASAQLPTYANILMCLDLMLNHNINDKQKELVNIVFKRASIVCPDYNIKAKKGDARIMHPIW